MIPDKIYIPKEYTDNDITPIGVTTKPVFPNDVCYIRKDALMEWAKEQLEGLKSLLDTDPYKEVYVGKCEVYKELIDKLNSI